MLPKLNKIQKRGSIMNKTELIAEVAKKCAMSKKDA